MFQKARLKLTAWYLLIIILISVSFSFVIYRVLISEVDRFTRIQRLRIERRLNEGQIIPPQQMRMRGIFPQGSVMDPELVEEIKHRLLFILLSINGGILIISGGLGYFLAGRTLNPIQDMIDEQNRFITDSSHELRTPLTSLKTAMEVSLRDKNLSLPDTRTLISESITEVNKLQSLSDELLKLAQYQKPGGVINFQKISVREIVKNAVRKINLLAKHKNIKIKNNVEDIFIYGDGYGLCDLMVILLDNAVKYSPENKSITVSSKKSGNFTQISVGDEGIGIDKKDIPYLFDRFYRASSARGGTNATGYGLGLSIAKKIAEIHKGSISVASTIGKESVFTISLPLR